VSDPLVSVITTTHNHENWIVDCIASVRRQTYTNWEMLVLDDGSTDRTASQARACASYDKRITFISQDNKGVFQLAENYNALLDKAKGKYVALLDGDDVWYKDKLQRQVHALESHPECVFAWGRIEHMSHDMRTVWRVVPSLGTVDDQYYNNWPVGSILKVLIDRNPVGCPTYFIRKDALDQIGGFQQTKAVVCVDYMTLVRLALVGEFYFDRDVLARYRVSPKQMSQVHKNIMHTTKEQFVKELIAELPESVKALIRRT
jgi:glycosyltransferase involved in cell wall biosynthesis